MAIIDIVSEPDGKGGSWDLQRGLVLTVRAYVMTDDKATDPEAFLRGLGLNVGATYRYPLSGTPTATNPFLFLQSITIDEVSNDGKDARLTVTFAPLDPSKDDKGPVGEDGNRNPFEAPPRLRWATEWSDFALMKDKTGTPILNKAGDPFEPGITIPVSTPVAIVSRTEREFNLAWVQSFKGRVNGAEWMGWPAGSVLCRDITADREWNADVNGVVWAVEYQFAFRPPIEVSSTKIYPGWAVEVLNAGLREKTYPGLDETDKGPIIRDGAPVSSPYALDENGTSLPPDTPIEDYVYLLFDVYPEADFAGLDLPPDLFSAGTPETP